MFGGILLSPAYNCWKNERKICNWFLAPGKKNCDSKRVIESARVDLLCAKWAKRFQTPRDILQFLPYE